jgi:hypothetical protein
MIRTIALVASLVTAFPLVAACSKSPGSDAPGATATTQAATVSPYSGSCDLRSAAGICSNFKASADADAMKGACGLFNGVYSKDPCPKEHLVATCEDDDSVDSYYSDGPSPSTVDDARAACGKDHKFVAIAAPTAPAAPAQDGKAAKNDGTAKKTTPKK